MLHNPYQRTNSSVHTAASADEIRPENRLVSLTIASEDKVRTYYARLTLVSVDKVRAKRTDRTRLTVASVDEVRPDDHLLRKAEDAESSTLQFKVVHVPGVSDEFRFLEKQHPAS